MVEACQTDSECNGLFSTGGTDYAIGAFTAKKGLNSIVGFVSNCPNVIDGLTPRVTFVFGQYFSTILSLRCVTSFWTDQDNMKFPHFPSRKKIERLNRQDEKIFAEASELAQLRLEQSIADLRMAVPTMNDTLGPHGTRPLKKFTNLF